MEPNHYRSSQRSNPAAHHPRLSRGGAYSELVVVRFFRLEAAKHGVKFTRRRSWMTGDFGTEREKKK
jgi:hypothetical protein